MAYLNLKNNNSKSLKTKANQDQTEKTSSGVKSSQELSSEFSIWEFSVYLGEVFKMCWLKAKLSASIIIFIYTRLYT